MENLVLIICLLLSVPTFAGESFSAYNTDGKHIYLGIQNQKSALELSSYLKVTDIIKKQTSSIKLPNEIRDRSLVSLFIGKDKLYVVSQWTIEQGDEPQIHSYNLKSKKWQKLGGVDCTSIISILASKDKITFNCERTTATEEQKISYDYPIPEKDIISTQGLKYPADIISLEGLTLTPTKEFGNVIKLKFEKGKKQIELIPKAP